MIPLLFACSPPEALLGTLVDGRTGAPIRGEIVRADNGEAQCLRLSEPTGDDGAFRIEAPCSGDTRLAPVDESWWTPNPSIKWSVAAPSVVAWRAPLSDGVYRLSGVDLIALPTNTTLAAAPTAGASRYPLVLPAAPPILGRQDVVVLSGASASAWTLAPLLPATDRGPKAVAWFNLGSPIAIQFKNVSSEDRLVHYLPVDSLAEGRYVLASPDHARAVIFDTSGS